jgi:hypothetical protein
VDSLLNQSFVAFDVFLIKDGCSQAFAVSRDSTDRHLDECPECRKTIYYADQICASDSRFQFFCLSYHAGGDGAGVRNFALLNSDHEIITYLNDESSLLPDQLSKLFKLLHHEGRQIGCLDESGTKCRKPGIPFSGVMHRRQLIEGAGLWVDATPQANLQQGLNKAVSDELMALDSRKELNNRSTKPVQKDSTVEIVVARYDEGLDWLADLLYPVTVYNKGSQMGAATPLSNIGRESHTYLWHITSRYENLAPVTVFCQGDAPAHAPNLLESFDWALNEFGFLCDTLMECDLDGAPHHPGLPILPIWHKLFPNQAAPRKLLFGPGANFYASRAAIRSRDLAFYQRALDLHFSEPLAPWVFERLWFYLFCGTCRSVATGEQLRR